MERVVRFGGGLMVRANDLWLRPDYAQRCLESLPPPRAARIVEASDSAPIRDVMHCQPVTIDALESGLAAARQVIDHHLAALPVVARDGRLLGVVTVDAAVGQVAPVTWRHNAPRLFS